MKTEIKKKTMIEDGSVTVHVIVEGVYQKVSGLRNGNIESLISQVEESLRVLKGLDKRRKKKTEKQKGKKK